MSVDKETLFKPRLPEADVEVPGIGIVRVRGLSRTEVLSIQQKDTSAPGAFERVLLAYALMDPELTEGEVGEWQAASIAGELEPVTAKVTELSGLSKDSAKNAYKEFESNPDAEFRVLPGAEAIDDSDEAA